MRQLISRQCKGCGRTSAEYAAHDPAAAAEAVRQRPGLRVVVAAHVIQAPYQTARAPAADHVSANHHPGEGPSRNRHVRTPFESEHDADADRTVRTDARVLHDREDPIPRRAAAEPVAGIRKAI